MKHTRIGYLEQKVLAFINHHANRETGYRFSLAQSEVKRMKNLERKGFLSCDMERQCFITPVQAVKVSIAVYHSLHT